MDRETPRSVMFDDLRKFGGITNRDTAWMLLRSTPPWPVAKHRATAWTNAPSYRARLFTPPSSALTWAFPVFQTIMAVTGIFAEFML